MKRFCHFIALIALSSPAHADSFSFAVAGRSITSLEGLRALDKLPDPSALHPIQEEFVKAQAMQCGYCVSGPILYGYAFVRDNPKATRAEIEQALTGILCRCCAHTRMIDAIQRYAKENR